MKEKYIFGKLGNKRQYLYIKENIITIKSGGTALFNDKFLTEEHSIKMEDITNIDISRPNFKPGYMIITTSAGKNITLIVATLNQYKDAISINNYIFN